MRVLEVQAPYDLAAFEIDSLRRDQIQTFFDLAVAAMFDQFIDETTDLAGVARDF